MKKTIIACIAVLTVILGTVIYWMNGKGQEQKVVRSKVQELKIGQVYEVFNSNYSVFTDETHFVSYFDYYAQYKSQKEIDTLASDSEQAIYPSIDVSEGTYQKRGDDYILTYKKTVTVFFKDYDSLKNKEYFDITNIEENEESENPISKLDEGYALVSHRTNYLHKSDVNIPTSIDEFLSEYTYVPKED